MNARRLALALVLFGATLLEIALGGCSLIGAAIGASLDHAKPDSLYVQAWQLDTLRVGARVRLWLNDGATLSGVYSGTAMDSTDSYRERYADFLAGLPRPPAFPQPGDSIGIVTERGVRRWKFLGYDYDHVVVRDPDSGSPWSAGLRLLAAIDFNGERITPRELRRWMRTSHAPLLSSLLLSEPEREALFRRVPLSDIDLIQYANAKHGAATGFLLGLCVDLTTTAVILIVASNDNPPPPPSNGSGESCPYVYSHDGREFVLDAEAFTGALVRSRRMTDACVLEHLRAADGACRVTVAGRPAETEFVDALALAAIDHAPGTEVVASGAGEFHALRSPRAPLLATDYGERVVTDLVAARDSLCWISNPVGRDPDDAADRRDGLVLRFERAAGANRARLVFTIRNTPWLIEMERHLLGLAGPALPLWYAQMNALGGPRREFDEALEREAGLRVDLWNGRAWERAACLPFAGPAVARSVVLPIDLTGIAPGDLRVRIESTPGLWAVDRVQADFTEDSAVVVTALPLRTAETAGGDVRAELGEIDGDDCPLEAGDEVLLSFAAPPERPGWERSYGMLCTGYYNVHVEPQRTPQWALLRRLAREPGAFGGYTLDLTDRWLRAQETASR
jgi:hypothetical protein